MGYDVNTALEVAQSYIGRATYSMEWNERDGQNLGGTLGFDCSGFVYHVLNHAGAWDDSYLGRAHYTGTLKGDLEAAGFVETNAAAAGVVFIWGDNYGAGAGGVSHTGIFVDDTNIIDSSWYTAGAFNGAINIHDHDQYWVLDGKPEYHFFVYTGETSDVKPQPTPQPIDNSAIGKFIAAGNFFTAYSSFRVDEIAEYNGIMQLVNHDLAGGDGWNWNDNGIAWGMVDNTSRSNNENVQVGDYVKLDANYNTGSIDQYDRASNGVGIDFGDFGRIWFDADAFLAL